MSRNHNSLNKRRWEATRRATFKRDNRFCVKCGNRGILHCHHVVKLEDGGNPYDINNCETICKFCHTAEHQKEKEVPDKGTG